MRKNERGKRGKRNQLDGHIINRERERERERERTHPLEATNRTVTRGSSGCGPPA